MAPRILITGSRTWTDKDAIKQALKKAWRELGSDPGCVLVSGNCPKGADLIAETIWRQAGMKVELHPADWKIGRAAGPVRNKLMVDLGADLCLAFVKDGSKGAAGCAKLAENAGIRVILFTD
jgi:Ni,Fe-hydrogenase III small subunit